MTFKKIRKLDIFIFGFTPNIDSLSKKLKIVSCRG